MSWQTPKNSHLLTYAVILFFVFDGFALGLNIWLTQRVQAQTVELNLAGRQRMLSQKMVKEFLQAPPGAASKAQLDQLTQTISLFDRTLTAFRVGGATINTDGSFVLIDSMSDRDYFQIIELSWSTWLPLRATLLRYTNEPTPSLFVELNKTLSGDSAQLLEQMNALTLEIESQARYETGQIRLFQTIALILGMLNFFAASWLYRIRVRSLEKEQSLINSLLNTMPSAMVFINDQGELLQANPKFAELLGIDFEIARQHKIHELIVPSSKHDKYYQLSDKAFNRATVKVETSSAYEGNQHLTIWRIEDASQDIAEKEALSDLAYKDSLTGLDNRLMLESFLSELTKESSTLSLHAIMFLDLNEFKSINDTFGHSKGDAILREVGFRLKQFNRDDCRIARYGGDEFIIGLSNISTEERALLIAHQIIESLKAPFYVGADTLNISASIGITTFAGHQTNISKLLHFADKAMYVAKQKKDEHNIHLTQWKQQST